MKRILPAFLSAALIHAAMLTVNPEWLMHRDRHLPRTQVISMQLVDRSPVCAPGIHPMPASPPSLPPEPQKPTVKKKPAMKQPKVAAKKPAVKKVSVLPSPNPIPKMSVPQAEPEPDPPRPVNTEKAAPAASDKFLTAARPSSLPTPREAGRVSGKTNADKTAVVKATPRYSLNPPPVYPSKARRRGYQGMVIMDVFVKADGRVSDMRIIESSNHKVLDRAALHAVRRWQFEPGRQGIRPIAMWVRVPVKFSLK